MTILVFTASSLPEISKKNGSINLQHQTDKERKRNYSFQAIDLLNPSNQHPKWELDPLTLNPVLQPFS